MTDRLADDMPDLDPAERRAMRIMQEDGGIAAARINDPREHRLKGAILELHRRGLARYDERTMRWVCPPTMTGRIVPDLRRAKRPKPPA